MVVSELGSPSKIALELIESSYEQLEQGTNDGDHAFHRLMEEFETRMKAKLANCDIMVAHHVAICLTSAYRRAIDKGEEPIAEEIRLHLCMVAMRLCEVSCILIKALDSGGQSGKLLAECVRTGDASSRIRL